MNLTITEEMIAAAIDRLIAERLSPEEIDRRVEARIEELVGTLTLEQVAARWQIENLQVVRRLLRRLRVPVVYFNSKTPRWRVAAIAEAERSRELASKLTKISRKPFALAA